MSDNYTVVMEIFTREFGGPTYPISLDDFETDKIAVGLLAEAGFRRDFEVYEFNHWIDHGLRKITEVSLRYPDFLFICTCYHEDRIRNPKKYYVFDGRYQMVEGEIQFPEFDPSKLIALPELKEW